MSGTTFLVLTPEAYLEPLFNRWIVLPVFSVSINIRLVTEKHGTYGKQRHSLEWLRTFWNSREYREELIDSLHYEPVASHSREWRVRDYAINTEEEPNRLTR